MALWGSGVRISSAPPFRIMREKPLFLGEERLFFVFRGPWDSGMPANGLLTRELPGARFPTEVPTWEPITDYRLPDHQERSGAARKRESEHPRNGVGASQDWNVLSADREPTSGAPVRRKNRRRTGDTGQGFKLKLIRHPQVPVVMTLALRVQFKAALPTATSKHARLQTA